MCNDMLKCGFSVIAELVIIVIWSDESTRGRLCAANGVCNVSERAQVLLWW